jgi:Zn-dependent peptidase ImmA (M78 family)
MWNLIKDMAEEFNVSKQAMSYRLQNLGLINENEENILK